MMLDILLSLGLRFDSKNYKPVKKLIMLYLISTEEL